MKKFSKLIRPITTAVCGLCGFFLIALGTVDVQADHVKQGSALLLPGSGLVGYAVGKKKPKDRDEEGDDSNGD
jgi:hypothetical protein